jgi:Rad3-related DNA helicase
MLPSPSLLLSNPKFPDWYPGQDEVVSQVMRWLSSDTKFLCISAPTGSGKSLIAMVVSQMSNKRTVVLTATKGLQAQLMKDYRYLGLEDIRGQNSYGCKIRDNTTVDEGPCHTGYVCDLKEYGCLYYDQLRAAKNSKLVVTNYAYFLTQSSFSDGLSNQGQGIDLLVLDEAHLAFRALESFQTIQIGHNEILRAGGTLGALESIQTWQLWATQERVRFDELIIRVKRNLREQPTNEERDELRKLEYTESLLKRLAEVEGKWIWEQIGTGFRFIPVWPKSKKLFHADKVLVMSASLSEKTLDSIGIPSDNRVFTNIPSQFPAANTPITHIPTVRVDHRVTDEERRYWVSRIDQIIDRRKDRKGIIFTVSYERRNWIKQYSRNRHLMYSHSSTDVVEMVNRFRRAAPPAVFLSPAITSGWDFPGKDCSYIIVSKVPFPDTRSPVMSARKADDKEWTSFMAMETIVQETGRGTRSAEDKCEVFIIDDHWKHFYPRYRKFAPEWFQDRVRGSWNLVPEPPF